jgi:hypothetical protein
MRDIKLSTERWEMQFPFNITGHVFTGVEVLYVRVSENGATGHGEGAGIYYFDDLPGGQAERCGGPGTGAEPRTGLLLAAGRNASCALWICGQT